MSCVCCFFSPEYQMTLKRKTFSELRFEDRLEKYKKIFLEEIDALLPVGMCNCEYAKFEKGYSLYRETTDKLLITIKQNKKVLEQFFDSFIEIYIEYITNGAYKAIKKFSDFLDQEVLKSGSEIALDFTQLLFRAREKTKRNYDELELFHVPFSVRCNLSNQRFSISGQPMLYLAKSIVTAEREIVKKTNKLVFSAFLPNYSYYYQSKIYNLDYHVFDSIVKNLPALCKAGARDLGNAGEIDIFNVKRDILTNILLFPLNSEKKSFIEEYALPQMFTSIIQASGFIGIEYPSAKSYSDIKEAHLFSDFNKNVAFFVKYQRTENFDRSLKNSFLQIMQDKRKINNFSLSQIKERLEKIKAPDHEKNYNDWLIPISKANLHLDYLEKARIKHKYYFETKEGKIELFFILKLCEEMEKQIKIQQQRIQ